MAVNTSTTKTSTQLHITDYLKPWDNPQLLKYYYNELDYSTSTIAEEVANGNVSAETVRKRLHKFDIITAESNHPSSSDPYARKRLLLALDKDAIGKPKPGGDDSYKKYKRTNTGDSDAE